MVVFCLVWLGILQWESQVVACPGQFMSKTICYTIVYIPLIFTVYRICSIRRRSCNFWGELIIFFLFLGGGGLRLGFPASWSAAVLHYPTLATATNSELEESR